VIARLAWLLRRAWCVVVGHRPDPDTAVNSQPYVIRHCTRCNRDVYQRLG
jgi:hypothetical protein